MCSARRFCLSVYAPLSPLGISPPPAFFEMIHLKHLSTSLFSTRSSNGCLDLLDLFGRWQDSRYSQRLDPQFASPTRRVIEMLVLFIFDLFMRFLKRPGNFSRSFLCCLADQVPVEMIFGFSQG